MIRMETLPCLSDILLSNATLIKQGAEARIYLVKLFPNETETLTNSNSPNIIIKHRFKKAYRHSKLDEKLTNQRIIFESRILSKANKFGIRVPKIKFIYPSYGLLGLEYLPYETIRNIIFSQNGKEKEKEKERLEYMKELMKLIGLSISKLHSFDIIHGDLTTSNILEAKNENDVVIIDFGLSSISNLNEDKAVDLYVLERAFNSTHPGSEMLFQMILDSYEENYKDSKAILQRLNEVRLRGRKRSMVG